MLKVVLKGMVSEQKVANAQSVMNVDPFPAVLVLAHDVMISLNQFKRD